MASSPPPLRPRLIIPISPELPENGSSRRLEVGECNNADSASTPASALLISPAAMPLPVIHTLFDRKTGSGTYIIADPVTEEAAVIDPILDFETHKYHISTHFADSVLDFVEREGYIVTHILETGVHRKHISASRYVQDKLNRSSGRRPRLSMGRNMDKARDVLSHEESSPERVSVEDRSLDKLFADAEKFRIGNIVGEVMYLSTETEACSANASELVAYLFGPSIFTNIPNGIESLSTSSRQRLFEHSADHTVYGIPLNTSEASRYSVTIGTLKGHLNRMALDATEQASPSAADTKATSQSYATEINNSRPMLGEEGYPDDR